MRASRTAPRTSASIGGFSLLEVLVALALLALALTILLGSMSSAARQVRHSEQTSRATLYAQSVLSRLDVGHTLRPGRLEGEFEGAYRWTLEVAPYVAHDANDSSSLTETSPRLLKLSLEIRWGEGGAQAMRWQTVRLQVAEGLEP